MTCEQNSLDDQGRQRRLDLTAGASAEEGIRQGLEDQAAGRTRLAAEVFNELRIEWNLLR